MHRPPRPGALALIVAAWLPAVAVAAAPPAGTAAADRALAARLDSLLSRYHQVGRLNGVALVAKGGEVLLEKGYGKASCELDVPNRPDTKMWIASVTKVFTATMVMRLADRGLLSLDDPVVKLLPWYRADTGARMTVRHLLNHTSGLPDYMHLPGLGREGFRREAGDDLIDVRAFAQRWCSADLQWEPGAQWGYSNSGYVLLGAIVEAVTGRPFEAALQELILAPAGMRDSGDLARRPRAVVPGLASGYEKQAGGLVTRRPWNVSTAFGAGAMYATVGDLYRFDRALGRDDFVSPAARAAMFTGGAGHWGCGWSAQTLPIGPGGEPRLVVDHEGFIYWTIAQIWRLPEDDIFVALINNTGDAPLRAMFAGIADLLYGREPAWPLPAAADAVAPVAFAQGGAAAVARYRELLAQAPAGYAYDEPGLNGLGYGLLQAGRPADAVALFRLAAERFPQSGNAWDSLGEGLAAAGEREEAIAAYARALELNPGNRAAAERLEQLRAGR